MDPKSRRRVRSASWFGCARRWCRQFWVPPEVGARHAVKRESPGPETRGFAHSQEASRTGIDGVDKRDAD